MKYFATIRHTYTQQLWGDKYKNHVKNPDYNALYIIAKIQITAHETKAHMIGKSMILLDNMHSYRSLIVFIIFIICIYLLYLL